MRNWPTKKLRELIEERKEKNKQNEKLKVFAISNLYGFIPSEEFFYKRVYSKVLTNYKKVYKYDFAYNPARANVGSIGIYEKDEPCLVSPMYLVFRVKNIDQLYPLFLFKVLKSNLFINRIKALSASQGSIRQILKFEDFCSLEIPIPPLPIQQKIVSILDTIQSAIEIQNKIIETTKELKKSMMADLFKYGGPSFRKGRKLKKTEIGEIPEDWEVVRLGEVCERLQYGLTVSAVEEETGIKLLRITDIQEEKVNWSKVPFCKCNNSDFEKYKIKPGDILIARIGATTGKTYFIEKRFPAVFGSYLIRIHPKSSLITSFLRYYFQSDLYWKQINLVKGGRLKGGINIPIIENLKVPLLSLSEQREIADILQTIDQKIEIEQKKKVLYEELFKTMLNKLMSGEIDVEKIEI